MSEQDQVPEGSIPPKVSPFAKPEGASPITPATPGAPRPITVRLKPAAPAAATPAAAAQEAPVEPVAAVPLAASPRLTARVPIPELPPAGQASVKIPKPSTAHVPDVPGLSAPAPAAPTVRLRPVSQAGAAPAPAAKPAAPVMTPITPALQPTHPPTPGSNPLPDGPKPPSGAQVQAAKSKTSRISLDSAIGVAPMTPMSGEKVEPKTIRLKRPADLSATPAPAPKVSTAPIRQTSRIPDSVLPTPEAAATEAASVTQKKTLKIKRPGAAESAAAAAEGEAAAEGVAMTPISALEIPAKEESKVFTGIAVAAAAAAAVVMLLLSICLGAHTIGTVASKNTTASLAWGFELPWPGRISE